MLRNKKGDISVTIFVILTLALFIVALVSFSLTSISVFDKITDSYNAVEKFNFKIKNAVFSGEDTKDISVLMGWSYSSLFIAEEEYAKKSIISLYIEVKVLNPLLK